MNIHQREIEITDIHIASIPMIEIEEIPGKKSRKKDAIIIIHLVVIVDKDLKIREIDTRKVKKEQIEEMKIETEKEKENVIEKIEETDLLTDHLTMKVRRILLMIKKIENKREDTDLDQGQDHMIETEIKIIETIEIIGIEIEILEIEKV